MSTKKSIILTVCFLTLGSLTVFAYGYYFPKQYLFKCNDVRLVIDLTALKSNERKLNVLTIGAEKVLIKEFWFGYSYTIENYDLKECSTSENRVIICSNQKDNKDDGFRYADFDLIKSTYAYGSTDIENDVRNENRYKASECSRQKTALQN